MSFTIRVVPVLIIGAVLATALVIKDAYGSQVIDVPAKVYLTECKTAYKHIVSFNRRIKPSSECRVLTYYNRNNVLLGTVRVPEWAYGYTVPWSPTTK